MLVKKKYSLNPNNGKKYTLPQNTHDRENIDIFLRKNKKKKVVVVQGLGFVGAVMSMICANSSKQNYAVIGIDLPSKDSYWKIASINSGIFPLISEDNQILKYYKNSIKKRNFYATYDKYAYKFADIIVVDINLDIKKLNTLKKNKKWYEVNLSIFKKSISIIAENCKENVLVLVETTVPPGTCEKVIKPIFEHNFKKRKLNINKFKLGHSYERVMPGSDYIKSIINFPRVYSGINNLSKEKTRIFLSSIINTKKNPLTLLKNTNESELAKVLENSYRAINIALVAEWARLAEVSNVNIFDVINAIKKRPTHINMMYPGLGVGGYCLTKDPLLAAWSSNSIFQNKSKLIFSEKAVQINDNMPYFAYQFLIKKIKTVKKRKILLMGVSYKSEVADTRYSPVSLLYDLLNKDKASIILHDPYVNFWEEKKVKVNQNLNQTIKLEPEIIIITTAHKIYQEKNIINLLSKCNNKIIYNTVNNFTDNQIKKIANNNKLLILGRGDI